ncbi:MAG: hypothetical protein US98_C0008G0004 [Parcubacteria group bacterium GW2011_GWC1_38_6]|nr:MAG: hypothetical protein US98_C0008G0004 [Parcubacteria group bacterium GW2011_GWC1_38_6]
MINLKKVSDVLVLIGAAIIFIYAILEETGYLNNAIVNQQGSPKSAFILIALFLLFLGVLLTVRVIIRYKEGYFGGWGLFSGLTIRKEKDPAFFYLSFIVILIIIIFLFYLAFAFFGII